MSTYANTIQRSTYRLSEPAHRRVGRRNSSLVWPAYEARHEHRPRRLGIQVTNSAHRQLLERLLYRSFKYPSCLWRRAHKDPSPLRIYLLCRRPLQSLNQPPSSEVSGNRVAHLRTMRRFSAETRRRSTSARESAASGMDVSATGRGTRKRAIHASPGSAASVPARESIKSSLASGSTTSRNIFATSIRV
jgi:hypothetical protein